MSDLAASLRGEMALLKDENDPAIDKRAYVIPPGVGVISWYKPFGTGKELFP
jgi:hypothetical protein